MSVGSPTRYCIHLYWTVDINLCTWGSKTQNMAPWSSKRLQIYFSPFLWNKMLPRWGTWSYL